MPNPYTQGSESITQAEHIGPNKTGDNIQAKKVANYIWDTNSSSWIRQTASSGGGGGGAVTIADGDDAALGAKADASATTDTGTFSLISLFKRLLEKVSTLVAKDFATQTTLAALNTKIPASPATSANQQTDALTDTQLRATPVPVSGTVTSNLGTLNGAATTAKQDTIIGHLDGVEGSLSSLDTKLPAQGQALAAASTPVVLPAAQITTLTPPAAITGFATETTLDAIKTAVQIIDNFISGSRGLVTEDNSAAIKTAVELIDNAISGAGFNITQLGGAAVPIGAGTEAAAVRVTLPTNGTGIVGLAAGTNNIGDVDVLSSVSATLDHGSNLDIDTSAEQITSTSFACKFGVTVKSAVDNTDTVYIGNSDVTAGTTGATDGFPLEPGESITLPVNNSNLLYAIGAAANQKVFWSAV